MATLEVKHKPSKGISNSDPRFKHATSKSDPSLAEHCNYALFGFHVAQPPVRCAGLFGIARQSSRLFGFVRLNRVNTIQAVPHCLNPGTAAEQKNQA